MVDGAAEVAEVARTGTKKGAIALFKKDIARRALYAQFKDALLAIAEGWPSVAPAVGRLLAQIEVVVRRLGHGIAD